MVKLSLSKEGLTVAVRSTSHPKSLMQSFCGFDVDKAMLAAAAGAEAINERFGDSLDPKACAACVKQFSETVPGMKCIHCGWRDTSGMCTQHGQKVEGSEVCDLFMCVHEIKV